MKDANTAPMSLDQARQLVACLENGDNEGARAILETASQDHSEQLFAEVGKLTRQLHDSLNNFQLDSRIAGLATEDIPDAQSRLMYVISETEKAANITMDAVESSMPVAEQLHADITAIMPEWKKLMNREIELGEFKSLCYQIDGLFARCLEQSDFLNSKLTEILMAQGYQDLTGQVIRRVIELAKEVEDSLVHMLTVFGDPETEVAADKGKKEKDKLEAEGPIIDKDSRDDVVSGQDDVDDLLSSLGF